MTENDNNKKIVPVKSSSVVVTQIVIFLKPGANLDLVHIIAIWFS